MGKVGKAQSLYATLHSPQNCHFLHLTIFSISIPFDFLHLFSIYHLQMATGFRVSSTQKWLIINKLTRNFAQGFHETLECVIFGGVCNDTCQWFLNVCWDLLVRCQIIVNCSIQVCWRRVNCKRCGCRKREKMTDSTDALDVKMSRFGYRVDLIKERQVRVKDEANIRP